MNETTMTTKERDAIHSLRSKGFCVVVFFPDELGKVDPQGMERMLVEKANEDLHLYNSDRLTLLERDEAEEENVVTVFYGEVGK